MQAAAAEESEQCFNAGAKLSTVRFKTQVYEMSPDFWSVGVEKSKVILESILTKIKSYEKNAGSNWIDTLRESLSPAEKKQLFLNEGN